MRLSDHDWRQGLLITACVHVAAFAAGAAWARWLPWLLFVFAVVLAGWMFVCYRGLEELEQGDAPARIIFPRESEVLAAKPAVSCPCCKALLLSLELVGANLHWQGGKLVAPGSAEWHGDCSSCGARVSLTGGIPCSTCGSSLACFCSPRAAS